MAHKSSGVVSVDTVTRLWVGTEVSGFDSRQEKQALIYSKLSRPVLGPKEHPTTHIHEVLYRGAKQSVRDAECPTPCAAFKCNYTFTPAKIRLSGLHTDSYTFTRLRRSYGTNLEPFDSF